MTTCWTDQVRTRASDAASRVRHRSQGLIRESCTVNAVLLHHDGCTEGSDISQLKSPCEIAIHRAAFGYASASAGKTIARGVHVPVRRRPSPGEEHLLSRAVLRLIDEALR